MKIFLPHRKIFRAHGAKNRFRLLPKAIFSSNIGRKYLSDHRFLVAALLASLAIHTILLSRLPSLRFKDAKDSKKAIEVSYYKAKAKGESKEDGRDEKIKEITPLKEHKLRDEKVLMQKSSTAPSAIRDMTKIVQPQSVTQKEAKLDRPTLERKITVPALKSEKINNPVYLNYYQLVRERIRDEAYKNYFEYESGEVYLTFVLTSDGKLKEIKLIEEKSNAQAKLRNIGLKSIRDCDPFPPFPINLKYPELSFNVVISFEVKENP